MCSGIGGGGGFSSGFSVGLDGWAPPSVPGGAVAGAVADANIFVSPRDGGFIMVLFLGDGLLLLKNTNYS